MSAARQRPAPASDDMPSCNECPVIEECAERRECQRRFLSGEAARPGLQVRRWGECEGMLIRRPNVGGNRLAPTQEQR